MLDNYDFERIYKDFLYNNVNSGILYVMNEDKLYLIELVFDIYIVQLLYYVIDGTENGFVNDLWILV